jgi:hypothetical protein
VTKTCQLDQLSPDLSNQVHRMRDSHSQHPSKAQRHPLHTVIYRWGAAILLVGLVSALLIYVLAADDGDTDPARDVVNAKMYQHNLQVMGGKFAVLSVRFTQWLESLWHGRTLAYTVGVLALAIALIFWVGWLVSTPLPGEADRDD